jgi:hypothetical protein
MFVEIVKQRWKNIHFLYAVKTASLYAILIKLSLQLGLLLRKYGYPNFYQPL